MQFPATWPGVGGKKIQYLTGDVTGLAHLTQADAMVKITYMGIGL